MPITTTGSPTIEYANVKLLHMTRNNSVEDPITVAFAVTDETGTEQVINVQCPTAGSLFQLLSEAGWGGKGQGGAEYSPPLRVSIPRVTERLPPFFLKRLSRVNSFSQGPRTFARNSHDGGD